MGRRRRLKNIRRTRSEAVGAERRPGVSEAKRYLSSMPTELHLRIVHYLPRTSLATICQLDKHWRSVGTDELLRWLLPISFDTTDEWELILARRLLERPIRHFINTNNADALQCLLDFRPEHPYIQSIISPFLKAEPLAIGARVTKDGERFCLGNSYCPYSSGVVDAAFKFNDMSCMQLLLDHGLTDYGCLLDQAAYDAFLCFRGGPWPARPPPCADLRGGHNSVLNWLLAYPPPHFVQAVLIMWLPGGPTLYPQFRPLCDWSNYNSPDDNVHKNNMLIMAASRGHPASLQKIDELRMMVEILTDDTNGAIIPEARQTLSHALFIARGIASKWPGTRPLVAKYLQSVCAWEKHQSSSSGDCSTNKINNPPPPPGPPLILPPHDPFLHRLIDLKTYDEMLEPENWLELQHVRHYQSLLWLVSTEFLANEDAARRMRCFKDPLCELTDLWQIASNIPLGLWPGAMHNLLITASAFRRWHCLEVVLSMGRRMWPGDDECFRCPHLVLYRAITDAVRGEPGCADGRIIRKLLRIGVWHREDCTGCRYRADVPNFGPFRGGCFGWEPFRLAFVEQQQDREQRETHACIEMRDAVLDSLSIFDQDALDFLASEPSKALYRASKQRLHKRLSGMRERGRGAVLESSCGESSGGSTASSRGVSSNGSS